MAIKKQIHRHGGHITEKPGKGSASLVWIMWDQNDGFAQPIS